MGRFSSQDKHMTIVIYVWLISYGMIYDTVEPSLSSRHLFFVPANKKAIHWLLFKTSVQRHLFTTAKVVVVKRFNCSLVRQSPCFVTNLTIIPWHKVHH